MPEPSWIDRALTIVTMAGGTIGWIATVRFNRSATRSQHTFDVLLETGFDNLYQEHLKKVRPHFGATVPLNFDDPAISELRDDVLFLLNYYEFLAGALRRGTLSEDLFRDDQAYILKLIFELSRNLISELRHKMERPAIFESIEWLHKRWETKERSIPQRLTEWIVGRPLYPKR